jgi:hypothetical protein
MRVRAAGTPWLRGSRLTSITREDGRLLASIEDRNGATRRIRADTVALHDGIRANDFGLPATTRGEPVVLRAGDCREALGVERGGGGRPRRRPRSGRAAVRRGGRGGTRRKWLRQRRAQAVLAALFKPVRRRRPRRAA